MRILHCLKTSQGSRWAFRQIRELLDLGHEIHVVLPSGTLSSDLRSIGAHTYDANIEISLKSPNLNLKRFALIRELADTVKPDLIHSHFVSTTIALRLALGPSHCIKRIFQVPGPLHLENYILGSLEIIASGPSDYWLASCEYTKSKYLSLGVPLDRLGLVYYGVDPADFSHVRTGALRSELGIGPNDFLVGNVAFFYPPKYLLGQRSGIKGHEDLLLAIKILIDRYPSMYFVFIGSGFGSGSKKYFEKIKNKALLISETRIFFAGYRSDVGAIYPDLDLAVHPSRSENVGGAVESLMSKVPTLSTNVGGFPDLIKQDFTGWLCPSKSPKKLAQEIVSISTLSPCSRNAVAHNGYELASSLMNISFNARELCAFYDSVYNA